MNAKDTLCVLRSQGRCRRHGIAAMRSNDLLVSFKTPDVTGLVNKLIGVRERFTYAPPELSEPAITNTRATMSFNWNVMNVQS